MLQIAIPSVLQQSTVSIGMMIVQAVVNPFGTQALAGYSATMRVENVFSLIFVSIGNAISPYISQNLGAKKIEINLDYVHHMENTSCTMCDSTTFSIHRKNAAAITQAYIAHQFKRRTKALTKGGLS